MVNIGRYDENYLLQRAEEIVNMKTTGSKVMDPNAEADVQRFLPQGTFIDSFIAFQYLCRKYIMIQRWIKSIKCPHHFAHLFAFHPFGHSRLENYLSAKIKNTNPIHPNIQCHIKNWSLAKSLVKAAFVQSAK